MSADPKTKGIESTLVRVFIPKARLLRPDEVQALPVKDKASAAADGLWIEVACPDDTCTVDGGRICLPAASAATRKEKGAWLKVFCPEDRCYFDSAADLP
jgi:hypothetical protein